MRTGGDAGVPTVLLDAGGVLLDLDYAYLRRLLGARGRAASVGELSRFEAEARREIHEGVRQGGRVGDMWRDYFRIILGRAGLPATEHDRVIDSLWEAHQRVGLWTVAVRGAREAVTRLKELGHPIGVVSNAEGRVARDLDSAGFAGMFETVVDSHEVGVEKPDPAIFRIALKRMGAKAETTVYLGDVPAVDVVGARAAGIRPFLLDRHDLYADQDIERLRSIEEFPDVVRRLGQP